MLDKIPLGELIKIFGSRMKAFEILYLLEGIKPVVRHGFYTKELPAVEEFCKKNNLFLEKSPYKIILEEDDSEEGENSSPNNPAQNPEHHKTFSNKGKIVSRDNPQGMFFVYLSKNTNSALLACLCEAQQDHESVGVLLGYPSCCVKFFIAQSNLGSINPNLNPVHRPTNPFTNIMLRDKDICLLSHFPCSSECTESIKIAKANLEIIKKHDSAHAGEMLASLSK